MQHSSGKLERELDLAEENRFYLEEKRKQKKDFKLDPNKLKEVRKKHSSNKMCCWAIFMIIVLSIGLIYYFVRSIQDNVLKDFYEKKEKVEELIPQVKDETKVGVDQGVDLYNETKENIENIQNTYNQAQDTLETVQDGYDKAKDVVDTLKGDQPSE